MFMSEPKAYQRNPLKKAKGIGKKIYRDERSEYEFLDWLESLREEPIVLEDLRDEVDRWLTWLDRRFDRQIVNDRLRELEG